MSISRRTLFTLGAGGLAAAALTRGARAATATPPEQMGPFYPAPFAGESSADLTRVIGRAERALGQKFELSGRILRPSGEPVGYAMILIWQANAAGRYNHKRNYYDAPADPNFGDHALIRSAPDGTFKLVSVKPGSYPDGMGSGGWRTPHVHYEVIGEESRLVTQMYFEGEARNDADMLLGAMVKDGRDPQALIAKKTSAPGEPDAEAYSWDIVLEKG